MEMAINAGGFSAISLEQARNDAYEALLRKLNVSKLTFLKGILRQKNIAFDENSTSIEYLRNEVLQKQEASIREEIESTFSSFCMKMDRTVQDLRSGATNVIKTLMEYIQDSVDNKEANTPLKKLARIALHTFYGKIISGVAITFKKVYKCTSNFIKEKKAKRNEAYDSILQSMEVTLDVDGNVVDTRLPENLKQKVVTFLKSNNIDVDENNYSDIREKIYSLDTKKKYKLIKLINSSMENPINIDEEVREYEKTRIEPINEQYVKSLIESLIEGASVILLSPKEREELKNSNSVSESIGILISKLINSSVIQWVLRKIKINIPILEIISLLEETISQDNNKTKGASIELADREKTQETQIRSEEMKSSKSLSTEEREKLQEEARNVQRVLLQIIKEYMAQKGMEVPEVDETVEDFRNVVMGLTAEQKQDINNLLKALVKICKEDKNIMKTKLVKLGKTIFWLGELRALETIDIMNPEVMDIITSDHKQNKVERATQSKGHLDMEM